jgi:hypothetical protein
MKSLKATNHCNHLNCSNYHTQPCPEQLPPSHYLLIMLVSNNRRNRKMTTRVKSSQNVHSCSLIKSFNKQINHTFFISSWFREREQNQYTSEVQESNVHGLVLCCNNLSLYISEDFTHPLTQWLLSTTSKSSISRTLTEFFLNHPPTLLPQNHQRSKDTL